MLETGYANAINHLLWACRRGMLELDLILEPFTRHAYSGLPAEQQALFRRLLDCNDQDLYHWLIGSSEPKDAALLEIITLVRAYALQRSL